MLYRILLIALLLTTAQAQAQFRLGILGGVAATSTKTSIDGVKIAGSSSSIGEARTAYRVGLSSEYGFAKKWALQTALAYSAENYQALIDGPVFGNQIGLFLRAPYIPNGSVELSQQGLELPVCLSFQAGKKVKFVANAGFAVSYFWQRTIQLESNVLFIPITVDLTRITSLPPLNASLLGGAGAKFELSEKVALQAMPYYQYVLLPVKHDQISLKTSLAKVGLDVQLLYQLQ